MQEDLNTGGDGSQQPQECGIGPGQHLVAKFVECFPLPYKWASVQVRCWAVKLSKCWLVVLATKRGMIRPTTLCKEGLTWECAIATLALVGWSMLDLAAIQEGGDGRDGMLLD